jgi:hypothetical protein
MADIRKVGLAKARPEGVWSFEMARSCFVVALVVAGLGGAAMAQSPPPPRPPPQFGEHPAPAQRVVYRSIHYCDEVSLTTEVDERLGIKHRRSIKLWRGEAPFPATDMKALEDATAQFPAITGFSIYCAGGVPVQLSVRSVEPSAEPVTAMIAGNSLQRIR